MASLYLVPGGQYLFTSGSDDDEYRLCLWDIGYSPHAPMKLNPIARLENGQQRLPGESFTTICIEAVVPSSDGKELVVVVLARTGMQG